jgi:hypothetical protein
MGRVLGSTFGVLGKDSEFRVQGVGFRLHL